MVTIEERKILHNMLDKMCDDDEPTIMWETFFMGEEPLTVKKKRMWLMRISEDIEMK